MLVFCAFFLRLFFGVFSLSSIIYTLLSLSVMVWFGSLFLLQWIFFVIGFCCFVCRVVILLICDVSLED